MPDTRKVGLEFRNRLSVYSSRSLVGLHTLEGFPDFPFGDVERLYLAHGLLPLPVGLWPRLNNAAPSLQPHYRTLITTTGCGLQAPTGHLLGNAICDSWNTQRPRPTIRLRNIDPPHRRRKIAP